MTHDCDVVVLGAGVTGAAAALSAARAGARVCVIHGSPAATALFSGAWRGPCPAPLQKLLAEAGYPLRSCKNALAHPDGTVVNADHAGASHADGLRDDAVVCGIAGLPGFNAAALAQLWSERAGINLTHVTLALPDTPRAGWAPASLAAAVERDPAALLSALPRKQRVVLPPILGIDTHAQLHDRFGNDVVEALGTPPSLPGWRLQNALLRALNSAGVQLLQGRAQIGKKDNSHVDDVFIGSDVVRARFFVLATGKFLAGGIETDGVLREGALGLPVWVDHMGDRFEAAEPLILTHQERSGDQPLLGAGVHCDDERRPLAASGDVIFHNVIVAGSIRAGWQARTQGAGDCAQDGWLAGELAVKT